MNVSDNTIEAEDLGDFFRSALQTISKKVLEDRLENKTNDLYCNDIPIKKHYGSDYLLQRKNQEAKKEIKQIQNRLHKIRINKHN